jgi:hypothetical protein
MPMLLTQDMSNTQPWHENTQLYEFECNFQTDLPSSKMNTLDTADESTEMKALWLA